LNRKSDQKIPKNLLRTRLPVSDIFQTADFPELFFGIVAPIGVNMDMVCDVLSATIAEMNYKPIPLRITKMMEEIPVGPSFELNSNSYIESYRSRIDYANEVRRKFGVDALAALTISAVRSSRIEYWQSSQSSAESDPAKFKPEEKPVASRAYVIRQLKRPEEVALLRQVYGRQFIVVSAYSSEAIRLKYIEQAQTKSRGGLLGDTEAHNEAYDIISTDSKELKDDDAGQNVRDAFPLGDVFIDATNKQTCEKTLTRFIRLLFGHNQITPTRDEYGMYLAKTASLRSSDLSRQVGAAIFRTTGEVITLGCNEVPKAGGGTYWPDDEDDQRDFVQGYDPNDGQKNEIIIDVINRLLRSNQLSEELLNLGDPIEISKLLLRDNTPDGLKESRLMDLLEFGRIIHAEMSAISDAARKGVSVQNAVLFCTTFPCHICAKHIVAAGIARVVFLEPYPKSYAKKLHGDSIALDGEGDSKKVKFVPFIGVSPFRYRDLFEKGKRKSDSKAVEWSKGRKQPQLGVYFPSYAESENIVVDKLNTKLKPHILDKSRQSVSSENNP
jgi:deoxycytidylate deaminase